jgi:hypothetical protein
MFYSIPLTMDDDAILFDLDVRQLALRIPFEGFAQRVAAVRTLQY